MSMLCYRFCKMAAWLRSQSFAHGDIKPDNIIVRPDGTLTLVDYDGMFVPAMKGQKSPTIGTKDFSHPLRTIDDFDETIDDFALASIALSLKAISLDSSLLQSYGASDRLLFSATDYLDLSKSKIFAALQGLLADMEARTLLSMFLLACAQKDLSMCSFRLFGLQKAKEKEVWSTEVTEEDLKNAVEDEYGVKYSKDWKRLLKMPTELDGVYSIKKGVKVIADDAFSHCFYSLKSIIIPDSVTSIGDGAFSECNSLKSINIPDTVTRIGRSAFEDCYSLTSINIPPSLTTIEDGTFLGCHSLRNTNIPDTVTSIEDYAFSECNSLKNINIPNGVTRIGDSAFFNCNSLISITIPSSVIAIGMNPFGGCHADLKNESKALIYEHNILFNKDKTTIISYRAKDANYVIPDSVTSIQACAFLGCNSLTSIIIPDSVTSIEACAFFGCNSLTSINVSNSVISIGVNAFEGCISLKSINIPDSVTGIGGNAFRKCDSLSPQVKSDIIQRFGEDVFYWDGDWFLRNSPDFVINKLRFF